MEMYKGILLFTKLENSFASDPSKEVKKKKTVPKSLNGYAVLETIFVKKESLNLTLPKGAIII